MLIFIIIPSDGSGDGVWWWCGGVVLLVIVVAVVCVDEPNLSAKAEFLSITIRW